MLKNEEEEIYINLKDKKKRNGRQIIDGKNELNETEVNIDFLLLGPDLSGSPAPARTVFLLRFRSSHEFLTNISLVVSFLAIRSKLPIVAVVVLYKS